MIEFIYTNSLTKFITLKFFRLTDRILTGFVSAVLVTLFLVMFGLAVVQVFLRYVFNSGIPWADILARNLVLWVGILGAFLAVKEDKHFQIDVLTRFLSTRYQVWYRGVSYIFAAVICYFLGYASVTMLGQDMANKTFLNIPIVAVEIIIPVGFYLMMVQFVLRTILIMDEKRSHVAPIRQPGA